MLKIVVHFLLYFSYKLTKGLIACGRDMLEEFKRVISVAIDDVNLTNIEQDTNQTARWFLFLMKNFPSPKLKLIKTMRIFTAAVISLSI